jgi:hypothetical protein
MSEFLEILQRGMQEAQVKFQLAQQKLGVVQAEFQKAAQEFQAWQTLVNLETAKQQQGAVIVQQPSIPTNGNQPNFDGANKTAMVRELLRQHPAGMSPADIWKEMEPQMKNRAYLYSVLKRLKDRGDARERRGKYFLNPKIEEGDNQNIVQ